MKSKLLLSLGLVAILGMAQASENSVDMDAARSAFLRLSPEQKTALLAELNAQETAAPVVREESYTLPKWMEEQFGKGYRGEEVDGLVFVAYSDGTMYADMYTEEEDGSERREYRTFRGKEQTRDLLRAVIHGFAANAERIYLNFDALDDDLTKEVIDHINNSGFSNLKFLVLDSGHLTPTRKADLEQALLNSRSSKLKCLDVLGGSFEFAKAMAGTKNDGNPALYKVTICDKLPEGLDIKKGIGGTEFITHASGVFIECPYELQDRSESSKRTRG